MTPVASNWPQAFSKPSMRCDTKQVKSGVLCWLRTTKKNTKHLIFFQADAWEFPLSIHNISKIQIQINKLNENMRTYTYAHMQAWQINRPHHQQHCQLLKQVPPKFYYTIYLKYVAGIDQCTFGFQLNWICMYYWMMISASEPQADTLFKSIFHPWR